MKYIKPITDLRKTNEISDLAHKTNLPIFITKNGYGDLVIMSHDFYCNHFPFAEESKPKKEYCFQAKSLPQSETFGFIKVASVTPKLVVGDLNYNFQEIISIVKTLAEQKVKIAVFPELSLTSYSCRDMFLSQTLLKGVEEKLTEIIEETKNNDLLFIIGAPLIHESKLYNCAIVFCGGQILGIVPKGHLPNYDEFHELRHFQTPLPENTYLELNGQKYPFGTKLIFECQNYLPLKIAVEICEDLWAPNPPSTRHALNGATIIANLSASPELVGKKEYRELLIKSTSARLHVGYIYASAGIGESTTDVCFGGDDLIAEDGAILSRSQLFTNGYIISEIDVDKLMNERKRKSTFTNENDSSYWRIPFSFSLKIPTLTRTISPTPFLNSPHTLSDILKIQTFGLIKRIEHIFAQTLVLGLSGGLDSTLALLVAYEACLALKRNPRDIHCLTMPCFGTSSRTKNNAFSLAKALGVTIHEIDITESVKKHFQDINHDGINEDATFENAQARERMQVLMDYANLHQGFVIGTGDLSELALGWTTFNGDHMSMYGVNASIPKTLVRELVRNYATEHPQLREVLNDILDTPISPELKSLKNGQIIQATEEIIGPYILHDFFIYYFLRHNVSMRKLLFLANLAFKGQYSSAEIKKWLKVFIRRFFAQQFKRNCLPDGVKVGSVSLSPREDFKMVSDMSSKTFLQEIDDYS